MHEEQPLILVTGASGYVGGRLVAALEQRGGARIRCLARRPELLAGRFDAATEVVAGDVSRADTLTPAMQGVHTAYYLVHALGSRRHLEDEEQRTATIFGTAARNAGVARIIYLGGLFDPELLASERLDQNVRSTTNSAHMRSRLMVGRLLRDSGVPTIEFRASVIIGAGSLSFELIRALVNRLPIMVTPRWVTVEAQPIAITDVLAYLTAALDLTSDRSQVFEIGGGEVTSYRGLMREYARQRGLRRLFVPVPLLTPWLSSLWLGLVTPLFARVGRKLIDSITMPSVVSDPRALDVFDVRPVGYREAIAGALDAEDRRFVATRWSDTLSASTGVHRRWGGVRFGNRLVNSRSRFVPVAARHAFAPIQRIGGRRGWYYADALWRLRGGIDRTLGGVGMKRGRRDMVDLRPGDVVDCWRVVMFEPPARLTLEAEMRLPGRAWLQFEVTQRPNGARIRQTAMFDPAGLSGLLYWYLLYAPHGLIFRGMLRRIAAAATTAGSAAGHGGGHRAADDGDC